MVLASVPSKGALSGIGRDWAVPLIRPGSVGTDPVILLDDLIDAVNLEIGENDLGVGTIARTLAAHLADLGALATAQGMVGDGVPVASAASISSGSSTLTISALPSGARAWRVGDVVAIPGAGTAGAMLVRTITAVASSLSCTLSGNAATTVSSVSIVYGTNNTTAWQSAVTRAIALLKPLYSIGSNLPNAITITVNNAGLITFSTTGATSGNYYVDWDFFKLGWLPV